MGAGRQRPGSAGKAAWRTVLCRHGRSREAASATSARSFHVAGTGRLGRGGTRHSHGLLGRKRKNTSLASHATPAGAIGGVAMNSSDKQFEQRLRACYQEATQNIDPVTAGRLRAARRTAREAAAVNASPHHRARVLLPVGALAAVALAALMIWQPAPQPQNE